MDLAFEGTLITSRKLAGVAGVAVVLLVFALLFLADCSLRFLCAVFPRTTNSPFQLSPATWQRFNWGGLKSSKGKGLAFLGLTLQEHEEERWGLADPLGQVQLKAMY